MRRKTAGIVRACYRRQYAERAGKAQHGERAGKEARFVERVPYETGAQYAEVGMSDTTETSNTSKQMDDLMMQTAAGPKQVQGNAGMVTQHSMSELIALDKYLAAKKAAKSKRGLGIKFFALRPGGGD